MDAKSSLFSRSPDTPLQWELRGALGHHRRGFLLLAGEKEEKLDMEFKSAFLLNRPIY